jgi:hypothetical protein
MKNVEATEEPSGLKMEHPPAQNMKFLHFILFIWFVSPSWIRILPTKIKEDPDTDP